MRAGTFRNYLGFETRAAIKNMAKPLLGLRFLARCENHQRDAASQRQPAEYEGNRDVFLLFCCCVNRPHKRY